MTGKKSIDKTVIDALQEWESPTNCTAPLTSVQTNAILELTHLANSRPFPKNLPKHDVVSLLPSTPQSPDKILVDSEDEMGNLSQSLTQLNTSHNQIQTAQQFLTWFSGVEDEMLLGEGVGYQRCISQLTQQRNVCDNLLEEIQHSVSQLNKLNEQYKFVSNKTNSLHEACEELLQDQTKLNSTAETVSSKLTYFQEVDVLSQRLTSPTFSVTNDSFIPTLNRLDECIEYMNTNPSYKESDIYLLKYKRCLSHALSLIKNYVSLSLQNTTLAILPKLDIKSSADSAFTLFYGKFRANAAKIKALTQEIEKRTEKNSEYVQVLSECHQCYFQQREILLHPSVTNTINELSAQHKRDHCTLVRSGCAFLCHVCEDEYQLHHQFFSQPTPQLTEFLKGLCNCLYDCLRGVFVHINHLETLAELCSILRVEMLEEHVSNSPEQLEAFSFICGQMLSDVQERLMYRTHVYIQSDILNYKPSPGDLAYPEKLQMMESIAQEIAAKSNKEGEDGAGGSGIVHSHSQSSLASSSSSNRGDLHTPSSRTGNSPADLHGMWYPPVRRTLVCLSKLYRCLERPIFQGLSQEALSLCTQSLKLAGEQISANKTPLDAQLFQIKHLLILREQIAPFQVDFSVKEMKLDFTSVKSAAIHLYASRERLFSLTSNNALLEFLVEGTPQVQEYLLDSKKEVDAHLKVVCEQFINHSVSLVVQHIRGFLVKVDVLQKMKSGGRTVHISQQPFARAERLAELVTESRRLLKSKLPVILRAMQLYLASRDTEIILFRPLKTGILGAYAQLHGVICGAYSEEDQIVIACPTQEEISLTISSHLNK